MTFKSYILEKGLHSYSIDLLINKHIDFEKEHCKDIVKDHLIILKSKAKNIEHNSLLYGVRE